jgi:hypothetical protein
MLRAPTTGRTQLRNQLVSSCPHCSLLTTRQRRSTVIMLPHHCHCLPSKCRPRLQVERIADPVVLVTAICARVAANSLMRIYRIAPFDTAEAMLRQIAAARGKLRKGGTPNLPAAARIVLQDWHDGRIPFFTRPPSRGNEAFEAAAIVAAYSADFDADAVYAAEAHAIVAGLQREDDGDFVEATPSGRVRVRPRTLQTSKLSFQRQTKFCVLMGCRYPAGSIGSRCSFASQSLKLSEINMHVQLHFRLARLVNCHPTSGAASRADDLKSIHVFLSQGVRLVKF